MIPNIVNREPITITAMASGRMLSETMGLFITNPSLRTRAITHAETVTNPNPII